MKPWCDDDHAPCTARALGAAIAALRLVLVFLVLALALAVTLSAA
jgi:hypothetical protein